MPASDWPAPTTPQVAALRDLHRVLLLLNGGQSLDEVLRAAAEGVREVLGFGGVAVNLLTPCGYFEAAVVVGPAEQALTGSRYRADDILAELAAADEWGLLRFVPAGRYEPPADSATWRSPEPPADGPGAWQVDDALYAPLRGPDGDLIGVLALDLPADGRRPGLETRAILEVYAVHIGLAVSQARERERLRERVRLAAAVRRVVSTAAEVVELDEVLPACVTPLLEGFRADRAWIRLFADDGGAWDSVNFPADLEQTLQFSAAAEGDWPPLDVARVFRTAARVAKACWDARRTLVLDADDDTRGADMLPASSRDRILDWLRTLGHTQFVLVPLGSARQCLGYLVLSRTASAGPWTDAEEDAALDVGRELGRAIGTARVREREHELLRRLEELDAHRTEVFTTVVHELKNPLAAIIGNLEMARDDPAVAERAHQAIEASGQRMLALVQDMLTLARLREPVTVEHAPVDLSAVVRAAAAQLAAQASRAGVVLDLAEVRDGSRVQGDAGELEQLVLNLVSNAVKFSDPGSGVRVSLETSSAGAVLRVADEGLGITAADQRGLFAEFRRGADPDARRRPGSGLGLAIVARVVDRHGGRIEVDSRHGRGSTFTVRLPASSH